MRERRLRTQRLEVPRRPISELAQEVAGELRHALTAIEAWAHKKLQSDSRFHQALAILEDVAVTGQFMPDQRGDESAVRALQFAFDVTAIASRLPTNRVADLRRALEACGKGPLVPSNDLRPLQAQSQLVVMAAFSAAGSLTSQPTHSGSGGRKKPDILIENGLSTYAVEVKRPTATRNVVPRALDAAEQIRTTGLAGAVVIDVTDCLAHVTPEEAELTVLNLCKEVAGHFFVHGVGWQPGMGHVIAATVLARPTCYVVPKDSSEVQVVMHSTSLGLAFGSSKGALVTIRSRWLRDSLDAGLNMIGFSSHEKAVLIEARDERFAED